VPDTWNSKSEYPYEMPRFVPYIRTYRPLPDTVRSSVPPSPVVVEYTGVHVASSSETSIRYAFPYAASHSSLTWLSVDLVPRSTEIHCGSLPSLLAQRVFVFPSTAFDAGSELLSTDDAVAGLPCESRVAGPQPPPPGGVVTGSDALAADSLPAASFARTVYAYDVPGATVPSVYDVVAAVRSPCRRVARRTR
jgi:hypothetical protein